LGQNLLITNIIKVLKTRKEKIGLGVAVIIMLPALLGVLDLLDNITATGMAFIQINFLLALAFSSKRPLADILKLCLYYCIVTFFSTLVLGLIFILSGIKSGSIPLGKIAGLVRDFPARVSASPVKNGDSPRTKCAAAFIGRCKRLTMESAL
jgi:hypothetical protein